MRSWRAVLTAIAIFLIYALIPTKTYYWDGVLFSFYAEQAHKTGASILGLFHANHLIYTPLAYLVSLPGIRTIYVLQTINAAAGAVCAYFMFLLALRVTGSRTAAHAGMLVFAFGATWWKFATDADPYIISVLLCLLAVWFAIRRDKLGLAGAIVCHALAMLFHELAVFLFFPLLVATVGIRRRVMYIIATALAVGASYWAAYKASGHSAQLTFLSWITSYAGDTPVTHSLSQILFGYLGSYLKLFVGGKASLVREFLGPVIIISFIACIALVTSAIRARLPRAESRRTPFVPLLWAWFIPLAVFLAIFDPASTFHKLFIWPPLVLLICAVARHRARAFALVAAALGCWNFGAFIWPHSHAQADPVLAFADALKQELPRHAVIYYASFSPDDWYLRYFGPDENWKPLPIRSQPSEVTCVETTALESMPQLWSEVNPKWSLVNSQHNIRVGCLPAGQR